MLYVVQLCHVGVLRTPVVIMAVSVLIASAAVILSSGFLYDDDVAQIYLEQSVPFIGSETPRQDGMDGTGVLVAVIDTGVDFEHPDMLGWGEQGKVVGGHNFIWNGPPIDTGGHGTQVAGVVAADGQLQGVAPKSKILAYRVSEDGSGISSELIAQAIDRALDDGADVINISLGINITNPILERAVDRALAKDVLVVVAAGNAGPDQSTIGSPGRNSGALTVGATYNNLTSSLIATLTVDNKPYTVLPMMGSKALGEPLVSRMIYANYAKAEDFENFDVSGAIVVAERGSDVEGEMLYFSIKEKNAADAGAAALIVYNNIPGMFLGELLHEFVEPGYMPQIPVVSMEREEGLVVRDSILNGTAQDVSLHLFHNPDFIAHFSSRGPVSPFYIKPDLVAPGAYINTTQYGAAYGIVSGTSYAAPHASGAAALLLQKNPELSIYDLKSLLMTTAEPVTGVMGHKFSIYETGSGRLNVSKAYEADVIISPPSFVATTSDYERTVEKYFEMRALGGTDVPTEIEVRFEGPDFMQFAHTFANGVLSVGITVHNSDDAEESLYGEHEGRIFIQVRDLEYVVPFLLHHTRGYVNAVLAEDEHSDDRWLTFDISHPDEWEFVKIDVIDSRTEKAVTTTATPDRPNDARIEILEDGLYWIDARIMSDGESYTAYDMIRVDSSDGATSNISDSAGWKDEVKDSVGGDDKDNDDDNSGSSSNNNRTNILPETDLPGQHHGVNSAFSPLENLPLRQLFIVAGIVGAVGAASLVARVLGSSKD